jgi:RNA polymerase sigma-70 factor (ECF subfamily)
MQYAGMSGVLLAEHARTITKRGDAALESNRLLNDFLAGIEKRALRMATISTGNRDEALDIVQDAMMKLATRYGNRDPAQWPPLFYRILQNGITDWHRGSGWQKRWQQWFGHAGNDDATENVIDTLPDQHSPRPDRQLQEKQAIDKLDAALQQLPLRQQQAFMLRLWEGLDVAATAAAMGCSQGSVKTHYSRAIHTLRDKLEGNWP